MSSYVTDGDEPAKALETKKPFLIRTLRAGALRKAPDRFAVTVGCRRRFTRYLLDGEG